MPNNNDNNAAAGGLAVVGLGFCILAAFAFAIVAFVAVLLTIWALAAWEKPSTLFGKTITPAEARAFVYRGVFCAGLVSVFVIFAAVLFQLRITSNLLLYCALGGYAFGSVVITIIAELEKAEDGQKETDATASLQIEQPSQPLHTIDARPSIAPVSEVQAQPQPFRFATWNDEEELRK